MLLWLVAAMFVLAACQTVPKGQGGAPAVITNPSAATHAELTRIVSRALHMPSVTLAADALTGDSTLIVERSPVRGPDGLPLNGRETGRPEHFRLVKNGSRCVLVHEGSDERWPLSAVSCKPV